MSHPPFWLKASPALFVFLWSTGFIGATYGLPYAEPLTFLAARFAIVAALLVLISAAMRAPWPATPTLVLHNVVVGVLIHGFYLGGVFVAISLGMPTGLSALICGLQPVLTAILARPLLGERVNGIQWLGIVLGFFGLILVVINKAWTTGPAAWQPDWLTMSLAVCALIGITAASIYQKAFLPTQDIRTGNAWQYMGAVVFIGALMLVFEDGNIEWTGDFIFALAWLVLVLSLGAVSLLMLIIRHGDVSRVASLFYLVPAVTALMAYFIFDEQLNTVQVAGIAITSLGVALVNRKTA